MEITETELPIMTEVYISKLLYEIGAVKSRSEGLRMIEQGAVEVRAEKEDNPRIIKTDKDYIHDGMIIKCGSRFWAELTGLPRKKFTLGVDREEGIAKVIDIK